MVPEPWHKVQDLLEGRLTAMFAELTGREVIAFMSSAHQGPDLMAQVFVLTPAIARARAPMTPMSPSRDRPAHRRSRRVLTRQSGKGLLPVRRTSRSDARLQHACGQAGRVGLEFRAGPSGRQGSARRSPGLPRAAGAHRTAVRSSSTGCRAVRGVPWAICWRQETPVAATSTSGSSAARLGNRRRPPICIDSS